MPDPTAPDRERLRLEGVRKAFGATNALAGVDLRLDAGEVHALVGENGAGKSTLMGILAGAIPPDAGAMRLDGVAYAPRTPADGRRRGVTMIHQELALAPHLTVAENVLLGVEPTRGPFLRRGALRRRAAEALARVGRPDLDVEARVGDLRIAERQLVEIARAVAVRTRVLVLDEPTSSLAHRDVARLLDLVRRLRDEEGLGIVYISHALEEVAAIADRCTVLRDGRTVGSGPAASFTPRDLAALMVGRPIAARRPRRTAAPGAVALRLERLAGAALPIEASLELRRGEILGIAGLVGAGRTELLRAIFGLDAVARGTIRVATTRAARDGPASPARRWAEGVGFVSEDRANEGLALGLTIADNVTLPRLRGLGRLGLVARAAQHRAARRLVERLAIRCRDPRQRVGELSGGNQQKVALARLLHADVDLLLLDEPTRGIDVGAKAQVHALIEALAAGDPAAGRAPCAVLVVGNALPELLELCDAIAVMRRGRLGPARPVAALDEHRLMLEATGAEEAA